MVRRPFKDRIAQLQARNQTIIARSQTIQARIGKLQRAQDTRRKVLLGALVLHRLENNPDDVMPPTLGEWARRELPGFLTRDVDKALFDDLIQAAPAPGPGDADKGRVSPPAPAREPGAPVGDPSGKAPLFVP